MRQESAGKTTSGLGKEFESACSVLIKEGWIPTGGVSIVYYDNSWFNPMTYVQAFYR